MKLALVFLQLMVFADSQTAGEEHGPLTTLERKCNVIVGGKIVSILPGVAEALPHATYHFKVRVSELLREDGKIKVDEVVSFVTTRSELSQEDPLPYFRTGAKCIFFAKRDTAGKRQRLIIVDPWFGIQPYNSVMAKILKEWPERRRNRHGRQTPTKYAQAVFRASCN